MSLLHCSLSLIDLLQATVPLQKFLSLPTPSLTLRNQHARLLPEPLYILFYQATGYDDAFPSSLRVDLGGDLQAAERCATGFLRPVSTEASSWTDSALVYERHPMHIKLEILDRDRSALLSISFGWLPRLGLVIVSLNGLHPRLGSQDLARAPLLHCLLPGDFGTASPLPVHCIVADGRFCFDPSLAGGFAYRWAQQICGLTVPASRVEVRSVETNSFSLDYDTRNFVAVIAAIRARCQARMALETQLDALASNLVPVNLVSNSELVARLSPPTGGPVFASWRPVPSQSQETTDLLKSYYEVFERISSAEPPIAVYQAILERDKTQLQATVYVSFEYPIRPPVFRLRLLVDPYEERPSPDEVDSNLKLIESELNLHLPEEIAGTQDEDLLLTLQVRRLQQCFDIYCRTERSEDFQNRAKICLRSSRFVVVLLR